jgi:hypothetical protein
MVFIVRIGNLLGPEMFENIEIRPYLAEQASIPRSTLQVSYYQDIQGAGWLRDSSIG